MCRENIVEGLTSYKEHPTSETRSGKPATHEEKLPCSETDALHEPTIMLKDLSGHEKDHLWNYVYVSGGMEGVFARLSVHVMGAMSDLEHVTIDNELDE
ncbi:hypothetical protein AVEN_203593-1 [Araneus ventricosus]|uniref:Uncharacterized protein n=1 Tax=Araneus ventricosus TaxID=182803 RepID=A0A4Y2WDJ0_ARAVE|nr:hypothetical protein AVEN_203593-1 [Araneus ventricosus]